MSYCHGIQKTCNWNGAGSAQISTSTRSPTLSRRSFCIGAGTALLATGSGSIPALSEKIERDVDFVATPHATVGRMLRLADVAPDDHVIDLGSGDGRVVIAAAQMGARATGVEIDPELIGESLGNARQVDIEDLVAFVDGNIFEHDFSDATVVMLYLLEHLNIRLRPTIQNMRPGTRIVSHAFGMGDWRADAMEFIGGRNIYLWTVPARIAGKWTLIDGERQLMLELSQDFQDFGGTAILGDVRLPLRETVLSGDKFGFKLDERNGESLHFVGRIDGDAMHAAPDNGTWKAAREPDRIRNRLG